MTKYPGPSFPLDEAAFCGSCLVVFSCHEAACPKCGASIGLWRLAKVGGPVLTPAPESAGRDAEAIITRKGNDV